MKKATVTIAYDEETLGAIRLFSQQKNIDLDKELIGFLDQLYKRYVPASVREYLELRDCVVPAPPVRKQAISGAATADPKS